MRESSDQLSALRRRVARIGGEHVPESGDFALGHKGLDRALDDGLARGRLHEIFAAETADASSAAGFAAMLALRARKPGSAIMWLRTEGAERRSGRFYAPGFADLGVDPNDLIIGVVKDDVALLRSATDALRSAGLGAVVIECWSSPRALDLTASRRMALAVEKSGVTALLLRAEAVPAPSAAETRWSVRSAASLSLEANAPGHATLEIELLRRRAGPAGMRWRVEWDRDEHVFREPAENRRYLALWFPSSPPTGSGYAGRSFAPLGLTRPSFLSKRSRARCV